MVCPEDDVLDYMVMEAVALKVDKEDQRAAKDAERERLKKEEQKRLLEMVG